MPGRPLTAIVTVGVVVCGAAIALEAVGILFPAPGTGPERRTETILSQLGFDTESMVAPIRPVDLPDEATAREPVWYDHEPSSSAELPEAEADESSPATSPPGETRMAVALIITIPQDLPPAPSPDEEASPIEQLSPSWHPSAQPAVQEPEPAVAIPAVQTAELLPVRPQRQRSAKLERTRPVRTSSSGYAGFGWPLLDWLIQ